MTAQFSEILHYKGEKLSMRATPLSDYFVLMGLRPDFQDISTACWRCYVGEWDITLDRLYLVGIRADYKDGTEVTLGSLFPGYDSRVFAHWYSGVLSIPQGDLVEYVHMGFASVYERHYSSFEYPKFFGTRSLNIRSAIRCRLIDYY
jgi:hypothetical protein